MKRDEIYMMRCIELARKGLGKTRQNPLVGAVLVHENRIIGEGYHSCFGGAHAEVNTINSVKDKSLLRDSTLYVNLEPCSHQGKTPPCSVLIRDVKIPRIVVGSADTNPLVSGKGILFLKESGLDVRVGVKEKECRSLNRRFYTFHEKRRPYIILKWARSKDGFMDIRREAGASASVNWISNLTSRLLVHKWRSEEIAIMAGTNTILADDPDLNVRYWPGESPLRVVPDRNGRLFEDLKIFNEKSTTLIMTSTYKSSGKNIEFVTLKEDMFNISSFLDELYKRDVLSLLVEGGASLISSFIESSSWDEARVITGNVEFREGVRAPVLTSMSDIQFDLRGDLIEIYSNEKC